MFCADRLCLKPNLHFSSSSTLAEVLVCGCLVINYVKCMRTDLRGDLQMTLVMTKRHALRTSLYRGLRDVAKS